ncbi:protein kinase domain-containing protein [Amnibacterium setariae]|uniref:non-specific serine/threonine protein kinase n=1 Tax=Amnibacterium setariae TaxID=2306585 RepID=A0A3A1TW74_9MICO|nr:protein kinase [Amnibacterium setariae]RIX26388.1 GAF domain-containing protein [Amnibacterium setariae]
MPRTEPPAVAGRYRIGEVIGRGGRATVYEAQDPLLGRKVALKLFTATATSPEEVRLQEAEARLVAGLDHFALTTLFDAGVDTSDPEGPRIFLVMERVAGTDLRRRLREGPLTPGQTATLGSDLAQGLEAVHDAGFLHRDIKPANVLLARRGPSSRIRGKLTDFGIATIIGGAAEGEFTTGTAAYLAPEQVLGQDPTPAWDVYALGLVLLEAVTGAVVFPGGVDESALARLDRDPEIPDSVPEVLARALAAMTARDPADRPTAAEASVALQDAFVAGLVEARRVDPDVLTDAEPERLAAVRRVSVLDTRTDEAVERIVRLARRLLDVPLVLVSIVDGDREWFLSHRGLELAQVPRNASFAAETVTSGTGWTAPDLTADERADGHPLLEADPQLRAYAAAPLTTFDGHTIGAIAALDRRVRTFTEEETADLADLAAVTMRELDLRLLGRRVLFDR